MMVAPQAALHPVRIKRLPKFEAEPSPDTGVTPCPLTGHACMAPSIAKRPPPVRTVEGVEMIAPPWSERSPKTAKRLSITFPKNQEITVAGEVTIALAPPAISTDSPTMLAFDPDN